MEPRIAFLADYGVGKTTLLKSKAISRAILRENTIFVFLGGEDDGLEPVMAVANQMSLGSQPGMTVLSLVDLKKFYDLQHQPRRTLMQRIKKRFSQILRKSASQTPMELLKYWMQNSLQGQGSQNLFIDEAPVEVDSQHKVDVLATSTVLSDLASLLPLDGHLWISYHSKVWL